MAIDEEDISALIDHGFKMQELVEDLEAEIKRMTGALNAANRLIAELTERGKPCQPKALAESIGGHWHGFECAADLHPWQQGMWSQHIYARPITPHSWTWHPKSTETQE